MTLKELQQRYFSIPEEMKKANRWICYVIEKDAETGETKKLPMCALNGGYAKSNDKNTWTNFEVACIGCIKFGFHGLGFILGSGFFGIDLDNHPNKQGEYQLTETEFDNLAKEFIDSLNSYAEWSYSGKGIHIICKGSLPPGARRRVNVPIEMYDNKRFFTVSGNTIKKVGITDCTKSVIPLYDKYLKKEENTVSVENQHAIIINSDDSVVFGGADRIENTILESSIVLSDKDIIDKISASKNGQEFIALYHGNMSSQGNDHSAADARLCQILAFWTGNNIEQIDRIFRSSALMRKKWDRSLGDSTYGMYQIKHACDRQFDVYRPKVERTVIKLNTSITNNKPTPKRNQLITDKGDPVFGEIKQVFNHFDLTDTGNAEMFYAYFGDNFKYNKDNHYWMYWNGQKWISDKKQFVKKYADKLIDIMKSDRNNLLHKIEEAQKNDSVDLKDLQLTFQAVCKNIQRVSNSGGKEAMLTELEHLHDIPVENNDFDRDDYIINTNSGVVDLRTGQIIAHEKNQMLSKSTNCEIDLDSEPKLWIKFLNEVFDRPKKEETKEIIDTLQKILAYCLSGSTEEQSLYFLYGSGSNGKSVFINTITETLGDYADSIDSELLMQNPSTSPQGTQFSLASLVGLRLVSTTESEEGKKLSENLIKKLTGGDRIRAQVKYGGEFSYRPKYKIFMATNNLPMIRGGYATWRRIFLFPFLVTFEGSKKDPMLEIKLKNEIPQILGWIVKGFQKFQKEGITKPKCIEEALSQYKSEIDVVQKYLNNSTQNSVGYNTEARKIYTDYKAWCIDNHEFLMSESRFSAEMLKKGYTKKRTGSGYVYCGIMLNSNQEAHSFENDE